MRYVHPLPPPTTQATARLPYVALVDIYGLGGSLPWISVGAEWPASNLRWRASSQYNHLEALATFLIKGAVVWYAAVRTQWQLCQGNMLLDAMVCLANHGHQHDQRPTANTPVAPNSVVAIELLHRIRRPGWKTRTKGSVGSLGGAPTVALLWQRRASMSSFF